MTLILDAAPLVALGDRRDPQAQAVRKILQAETGDLVIPSPVTAEVDYMLGRRLGRGARLAFLTDLAAGRFRTACLEEDDHRIVTMLEQQYDDLDAGLADLSVVVVADRFRTPRIMTFDDRHFRTLRPLGGGVFTLLPSDVEASGA